MVQPLPFPCASTASHPRLSIARRLYLSSPRTVPPLYFMQAPFFISYVLLNGFAKYPIYLCRASSLVIYSFKASTAGSENTHDLRRVSNDSCSVPFVPSPGSWRGVVGIVQNAAAAPSAPRPACEPMRLHDVRPEHAAHAGPDVDLRGLCPTKEMRCR